MIITHKNEEKKYTKILYILYIQLRNITITITLILIIILVINIDYYYYY